MASELRGGAASGNFVYAHLFSPASVLWNGSAFEAFDSVDYSSYDIVMTEQGNSGIYVGDFPSAITTQGTYEAIFYTADNGSSSVEGDHIAGSQTIEWDGTAAVTNLATIPGAMSGSDWYDYVIQAFKRTDKEDEVFAATKDIIDEVRMRFVMPEDETEIQTTDLISTLGDYQLELETDFGFLIGQVFVQGSSGQGWALRQIEKQEYDEKYSVFGSAVAVRAVPKEFCIFGGKIYIGPVPDLTSYVYKINYTQDTRAEYDIDSVSIPFTDKYRRPIRAGVLSALYSDVMKNDDQAAKFGTLFENWMRMINRRNDKNRSGTTVTRYQGV